MAETGVDPFYKARGVVDLAVITDDRRCVACGYALRGLRPGGRCPECGRPILLTRSYGIDEIPLGELKRLRHSITLIFAAWAAAMALWFWLYYGLLSTAAPYLAGAAIGALLIAVPLITSFWSKVEEQPLRPWQSITFMIRALLVLAVASLAITVMGHFLGRSRFPPGAMLGATSITLILWVALQALGCHLLKRIAVLGRDDSLGQRFWNLSWALGLCVAFVAPYFGVTQIVQSRSGLVPVCCLGGYIVVIGFLVAQMIFGASLIRLRYLSAWAVRYRNAYEEKTRRMVEQIDQARARGEAECTAFLRD